MSIFDNYHSKELLSCDISEHAFTAYWRGYIRQITQCLHHNNYNR